MAITREFTPEELDELDVGPWNCVASWTIDQRRWAIEKAVVFPYDGAYWQVSYFDPSTEMQEGQDVWNDQETVTATKVEERSVSVLRWFPVDD